MVKLFILSDLHTEKDIAIKKILDILKPADILILAGDIGDPIKSLDTYDTLLAKCSKIYKHVIIVPGNHEYYSCKYNKLLVINKINELCLKYKNIHLLHRKSIILEDIVFIGATLWSIIDRHTVVNYPVIFTEVFPNRIDYIDAYMKDFSFIKSSIISNTNQNQNLPIVVITHYLPTYKIINPKYLNDKNISAYYSETLESLNINISNVKLWICGHTHEHVSYLYDNKFRIIANPLGYQNEKRITRFNPDEFIDI